MYLSNENFQKKKKKTVPERLAILKLDNRHAATSLVSKITFSDRVIEALSFPMRTNLKFDGTALLKGESISKKVFLSCATNLKK